MGTSRIVRGGGKRKRGFGTVITVLPLLALLFAGAVPASADDDLDAALRRKVELERAVEVARANTEHYRSVANQFQSAVNAANGRIADLAAKQESAQSEAEQLSYEIQIAQEQLQLVGFQVDETNALVDSLKASGTQLDKQLVRQEALYGDHLRAAYRQSRVTPLEMLLSSSSLADFATRLQALVFIGRQDVQLAAEINGLRAATAQRQSDLVVKTAELGGLREQVATTRDRLAVEKGRYDDLVRQAGSSINQQAGIRGEANTNKLAAQRNAAAAANETAALNKKLEEAEAAYEDLAAAAAAKSGLGRFDGAHLALWPLRGPITSPFGARWGGFHNGLDIAAPKFTPIRAAAAGIVTTVGRPYLASGDTAVVVIIAHGSNFSTLYGHLDDVRVPTVSVGQRVNAGEVIGYVGMTGWTTGPHLHFMTIANGRAVNPLPYLP